MADKEFMQFDWNTSLEHDLLELTRLAIREDLDRQYDWTSIALISAEAEAEAAVVARQAGIMTGLPGGGVITHEFDQRIQWSPRVQDGDPVSAGQEVARMRGPARNLLAVERTLLNTIGHLSGIATLTRRYVDAVAGTKARIFDTRKTTPGWRRLEKYAVRKGGGWNHRQGLFSAILIKDNHLALGANLEGRGGFTPAEAVEQARQFVARLVPTQEWDHFIIEVEVDSLDPLTSVLPAGPDIVLLDNMSLEELTQAVAIRNRIAPGIQLEASGGIRLENVGEIARTGVDRISVGALTHSAAWLDVSLDWRSSRHSLPSSAAPTAP